MPLRGLSLFGNQLGKYRICNPAFFRLPAKMRKNPAKAFEKMIQKYYFCSPFTADIAQLVRAPVCGTGGRRFEPGYSPKILT